MPIDFNNIITTGNREYNSKRIATINDAFSDLSAEQRAILLSQIIEESGGDPMAKSANGTYQGLLQWGADRYKIKSKDPDKELANQIAYIRKTLNDTIDGVSWTHGGKGSGYKSLKEAYGTFSNSEAPFDDRFKAFSYGYVRPHGKEGSYSNRLKVGHQIYDRLMQDEKPPVPVMPMPAIIAQPDATMVASPVVAMPIEMVHKKAEGGHLYGKGSKMYKVRQGENLSSIAKANNLTLSELLRINPQIEDPNKILEGDTINIDKAANIPAAKSLFIPYRDAGEPSFFQSYNVMNSYNSPNLHYS